MSESQAEKLEKLKKTLKVLAGFLVLGILDSIWLTAIHAKSSLSSACNIGSAFSCDVLSFEQYSMWLGIPVPIFSLAFYGVALAIVLYALKMFPKEGVRPYFYLRIFSWMALGITFYFAFISFGVLKTICPYCMVLYVVNIAFFVLAGKLVKTLDQPIGYVFNEDKSNFYAKKWFWVPAISCIAALGFAKFMFHQEGRLSHEQVVIAAKEARSLGAANARIVISEFSDFQCPYCRIAADVLKQLKDRRSKDVKLVYKFYPLDKACNSGGGHKYACRAAEAAYCASTQGKFWSYHDLVFTSQDRLPDSRLFDFAKRTNLDMPTFERCMKDPRTKKEVKKDIDEGKRLSVSGTPAIFINGSRYQGPITVSALEEAIDSIL